LGSIRALACGFRRPAGIVQAKLPNHCLGRGAGRVRSPDALGQTAGGRLKGDFCVAEGNALGIPGYKNQP